MRRLPFGTFSPKGGLHNQILLTLPGELLGRTAGSFEAALEYYVRMHDTNYAAPEIIPGRHN